MYGSDPQNAENDRTTSCRCHHCPWPRWLAVKLGLVGPASTTAAGVGTLAVTYWASPIDKTADGSYARISPLLFAARGIVPGGYAAFALERRRLAGGAYGPRPTQAPHALRSNSASA